jgi:hypothetical protein
VRGTSTLKGIPGAGNQYPSRDTGSGEPVPLKGHRERGTSTLKRETGSGEPVP